MIRKNWSSSNLIRVIPGTYLEGTVLVNRCGGLASWGP